MVCIDNFIDYITMSQFTYRITPKASIKCNYALGACPSCSQPIKRGDLVTRVAEVEGMCLRAVQWSSGTFNIKNTGERIVHKDCTINGFWTDEMGQQEAIRMNNLENSSPQLLDWNN